MTELLQEKLQQEKRKETLWQILYKKTTEMFEVI